MGSEFKQDYISKHQKIRDKLIELSRTKDYACISVPRLASELKMDIRTVRAHLKIMELDTIGVFMDDEQKQFCTREALALLTNTIKAH
jgi:hypothetical protein